MKEMELKINLRSLSEFMALKKTITQLLISVSIFSLVFSWSSLSSSTLLHYQNLYYFSGNSFHLMSIAMNKNCIFLIFNGILVFLAKTSAPPSASDLDDMLQKRIGNDELRVETTEPETLISDEHTTLDESSLSSTEEDKDENEDEDEDEDEDEEDKDEDEEDEDTKADERDQEFEHSNESEVDQVLIAIEGGGDGREEDENHELQNYCLFDGRDQEGSNGGEEVDEIEKLSNEELNKKFEDFIRRMKEEFRINQCQQQQLVLVK